MKKKKFNLHHTDNKHVVFNVTHFQTIEGEGVMRRNTLIVILNKSRADVRADTAHYTTRSLSPVTDICALHLMP